MPRKPKPKIENVTQEFGLAHAEADEAKRRMEKYRKMFFDLITIPENELATQVIYVECDDPRSYVATLYPKWKIKSKKLVNPAIPDEWKIIIQEDPSKKTFQFINRLDGKVYQRTVAESAPDIDMDRLKEENPDIWEAITFQPPLPDRELKPLDELNEDEREVLKRYLVPVKLTNRMEKPRNAKPEELEGS